jgi:hypothetical protein
MSFDPLFLPAMGTYTVALLVTAYFTRAKKRRFIGALAGGLAVAVVGVGVELLCQSLGVWHYPSHDEPYGPLLMYPVLVVMWSVYSLIGWRVIRRFGWRGEAIFLIIVTVVGTLRDYLLGAQALGLIAFKPGVGTIVIDAACWAGLTALAQVVMRLIAGPAQADQLARRPTASHSDNAT